MTKQNVGAVNTVKIINNKWIGYNTDGIGYVMGLKQVYPDLENAYVLILGVVVLVRELQMNSVKLYNQN